MVQIIIILIHEVKSTSTKLNCPSLLMLNIKICSLELMLMVFPIMTWALLLLRNRLAVSIALFKLKKPISTSQHFCNWLWQPQVHATNYLFTCCRNCLRVSFQFLHVSRWTNEKLVIMTNSNYLKNNSLTTIGGFYI